MVLYPVEFVCQCGKPAITCYSLCGSGSPVLIVLSVAQSSTASSCHPSIVKTVLSSCGLCTRDYITTTDDTDLANQAELYAKDMLVRWRILVANKLCFFAQKFFLNGVTSIQLVANWPRVLTKTGIDMEWPVTLEIFQIVWALNSWISSREMICKFIPPQWLCVPFYYQVKACHGKEKQVNVARTLNVLHAVLWLTLKVVIHAVCLTVNYGFRLGLPQTSW